MCPVILNFLWGPCGGRLGRRRPLPSLRTFPGWGRNCAYVAMGIDAPALVSAICCPKYTPIQPTDTSPFCQINIVRAMMIVWG